MKKIDEWGFSAIIVVIVAVAVALVIGVGFSVYKRTGKSNLSQTSQDQNSSQSENIENEESEAGESDEAKPAENVNKASDKPQQSDSENGDKTLLGGGLKISLPSNWTKKSDNELMTTLNGKKYVASFTVSKTETLSVSNQYYTSHGAGLAKIQSSVNTPLWVIRSDGDSYDSWVYVASCESALCSPKINGQFVFILLSDQTSGSPQKLNFRHSDSDANTVLGEFIPIIKSTNLLGHYSE